MPKSDSKDAPVKQRTSKSSKAGLTFPVSRVHRYLKKGKYANRISPRASVFMSAVIEYLVSELATLAGDVSFQFKQSRIIPRHLLLAIVKDDELKKMMAATIVSQGGVDPCVEVYKALSETKDV